MSEIVKLYLKLVENPNGINNYKNLLVYYKNMNMHSESEAFTTLLESRFKNENKNTNSDA